MSAASKLEFCLNCGEEIHQSRSGRVRKYCPGSTCRVAYHRRLKRYNELANNVTKLHDLTGVLVLELFPARREGKPEYSVLASSWNKRGTSKLAAHDYLSAARAAQLQGFDNQLVDTIMSNQPGWKCANGSYNGVSKTSRRILATHMMGNGVPFSLGSYVAKWIAMSVYNQTQTIGVQQ